MRAVNEQKASEIVSLKSTITMKADENTGIKTHIADINDKL